MIVLSFCECKNYSAFAQESQQALQESQQALQESAQQHFVESHTTSVAASFAHFLQAQFLQEATASRATATASTITTFFIGQYINLKVGCKISKFFNKIFYFLIFLQLFYPLYPLGLFFCQFHESRHISSMPNSAFQPNSASALAGFE